MEDWLTLLLVVVIVALTTFTCTVLGKYVMDRTGGGRHAQQVRKDSRNLDRQESKCNLFFLTGLPGFLPSLYRGPGGG